MSNTSKTLKSTISIFAIVISTVLLVPAAASAAPNGTCSTGEFEVGNGSEGSPYNVSTAADFAEVADCGSTFHYYTQTAEITLTGDWKNEIDFVGNYDGVGHTIYGISIDGHQGAQGLFNTITDGTIKNLEIHGTVNNAMTNAGLLAGVVSGGTIQDVAVVTDVNVVETDGTENVGGAIGNATDDSQISYLYVSGLESNSSVQGKQAVGGAIGNVIDCDLNQIHTTINVEKVYDGDISVFGFGGVVGQINLTLNYNRTYEVNESSASGNVTGASNVGGLVGFARNSFFEINDSYATGDVFSEDSGGGLIGYLRGSISNSYSTGAVNSEAFMGGLVGNWDLYSQVASIENSYASGPLSGGWGVGGLVGLLQMDNATASINNSFAIGDITTDSSDGAGLVARTGATTASGLTLANDYFSGNFVSGYFEGITKLLMGSNVTINAFEVYWTKDSSDVQSEWAPDKNAKPKSLFQKYATFNDPSWDFENIWKLDRDFLDGYLSLRGIGTGQSVVDATPTCSKTKLTDVVFAKNSSKLSAAAKKILNRNVTKFKNSNCGTLTLSGYSAIDDTKKKQAKLASDRARAVEAFMNNKLVAGDLYLEFKVAGKGVVKKGNVATNRKVTAKIAS